MFNLGRRLDRSRRDRSSNRSRGSGEFERPGRRATTVFDFPSRRLTFGRMELGLTGRFRFSIRGGGESGTNPRRRIGADQFHGQLSLHEYKN